MSARDTVAVETLAARATSLNLAFFFAVFKNSTLQ